MKHFLITFLALGLCFDSLWAMSLETRHINKKIDIQASIADVWQAWTTVEGANSFFGNDARIEMKIGRPYEIDFIMERPKGQRGTERSKLLAFVPQRMLAFEWGIARQFVDVRKQANTLWNRTWVVVFFKAINEGQTEVTLYHMGLGVSDKWNEVYNFYDRGWDAILKRLNQSFAGVK